MQKKKTALLCAALLFINLILCNATFAIEAATVKCQCPDYGYEFYGKDKCERFNRKLFVFNLKLNKYILRPVNIAWASIVPKYGMDRLQSLYNNINYPVRVVSCLLQKDIKGSKQETVRFITNTTIGFAGLYDPAKNIFKIEPGQEDMEQVLAHYNIKKGPYVVLPVVRGNVRELVGQLLNCPLRPFSYIPIAGAIANAVFTINNTTYAQPIIKKIDESYADPYQIAKQIDGITKYIKNENLDREDVFKEKTAPQNIIKIKNNPCEIKITPDIILTGYNPQSPLIDSMRTIMLASENPDKSKWAEVSVWNHNFNKKIKTAAIKIDSSRSNYKYRYILQKNKTSPLAIIYPSFGEGINSDHSAIFAEILYNTGYSVVIEGSAFQWEFVKSMPKEYHPGLPGQDAKYLRIVSSKIINSLEGKKACKFDKKIIIGTSFGALTALFTAAEEEKENSLGVSKYISINPPIELTYALNQLDRHCVNWQNDPKNIKFRAAITAEKIIQTAQKLSDKKTKNNCETFPFTDEEAELIIGFIMKQKLSDVVFAIENGSRGKKFEYTPINTMSFNDYGQKYVFINQNKTPEQFDYETSLYSISDFLQKNKNYKIYHAVDDYFVNPEQLTWLKNISKDKSVYFSNGSHLGFTYRKEFLDEFKKEIMIENTKPANQDLTAPKDMPAPQNGL